VQASITVHAVSIIISAAKKTATFKVSEVDSNLQP